MREYKFRGQNIDNKEWIFGNLLSISKDVIFIVNEMVNLDYDDNNNHRLFYRENHFFQVIPETVGQFTRTKGQAW